MFAHTITSDPSSCEPTCHAKRGVRPSPSRRNVCTRRRRRFRRAAAAVEFAVVSPIIFLFLLGIIEFGRMVMVQQVITNGSRIGARAATLDGATTSDVETAVADYVEAAITGTISAPTIDPADLSSAAAGDQVSVTVSVPFSEVSWLPSSIWLENATLTSTTVMRRETAR